MSLEPAKSIIGKLGGPEKVAEITGRHISRVYRWMYSAARGGTGGVIPHGEARKLLDYADANGIDLQPADFFASTEGSEVA
jgi:hypothetical protein